MNNIIFTGFMGCGKSTIARNLSLKLDKIYLDSDELIKNKFNLDIKDIFEKFGENFFREEEKNCMIFLKIVKIALYL